MRPFIFSFSAAIRRITPPSLATCAALLWAILPAPGRSQTFIGIEASIHNVGQSGEFTILHRSDLPLLTDGEGTGQSFGIKLRHDVSPSFSLSGAIAWNRLPALFGAEALNPSGEDFEIEMIGGIPNPDPEHAYKGDKIFNLTTEVVSTTLSLNLLGEWRPLRKEGKWSIGIAAGPTLHQTLSQHLRQQVRLTEPQNMRFVNPNRYPSEDNGRTITVYDGDPFNPVALRLGARGGLFAEFGNPESGIVVTPGIFYEPYLTSVKGSSNETMRLLTGQVNIMIEL